MKITKLFYIFLLLIITSNTFAQLPPGKKNVLLIMADDFNFWHKDIGYYPNAKTPNLDKLIKKGILFRQASCSSPVCNPSRNAFLSGYRPSTTGIDSNDDGFVRTMPGFENIQTLHQYFKDNGYFAYAGGKIWHKGTMGAVETDPKNWSAITSQATGSPGGLNNVFKSATNNLFKWSTGNFILENAEDTKLATHFATKIQGYDTSKTKNQPFFMACGFFRPHLPINVHQQFWDMYTDDEIKIPAGYKEDDLSDIAGASAAKEHTEIVAANAWKQGIHAYLAAMSYADYNVGIILDALENSPYKDNTIVLFFGDHGWQLGEKKRWAKYALYDQAHHTTFVMYDPSAKGNGQFCDKPVSLQDVYPTLVERCALPPKTNIEGENLAPLLNNPKSTTWNKPILMTYNGTNMLFDGTHRLADSNDSPQLYNLSNDPYEWTNLFNKPESKPTIDEMRVKINKMVSVGTELKTKLINKTVFVTPERKLLSKIEFEHYDEGANNHTYFDSTKDTSLVVNTRFRKDYVDLLKDGTVNYIGQVTNKEWWNYSITNLTKGEYGVKINYRNNASTSNKAVFYLGEEKIGEVPFASLATNTWTTTPQQKLTISNVDDSRQLKIMIEGAGVELDYFTTENFSTVTPPVITSNDDTFGVNTFTVSPNPNNGQFTFNSNLVLKTLNVYDSLGNLYATRSPNKKLGTVTIQRITNGNYYVRAISTSGLIKTILMKVER
ncbi:MAG: sulfatase-like hydrolase/transferase [Pseudarcicella sp.]|nr:sulfatase-like hydrolase/transferase [Pseudarcicella sp.]